MRSKPILLAALFALCAAAAARAEVYSFRDAQGIEHFASSPRPGWRVFRVKRERPDPASYDPIIRECAAAHEVDPSLVKAVIRAESGFDAEAVSDKGARGLMQLTRPVARSHGAADVYDPRQNVCAGARYLRTLLVRYGNDRLLALAAYNAGSGAIARHRGVPPYRETRAYVRKVLRFHRVYGSAAESLRARPTGT